MTQHHTSHSETPATQAAAKPAAKSSAKNPAASKKNTYLKANRAFSHLRKYAWIFTVLVAIGGLWEPKLGLLVIGIMAGLSVTAFFNGRYWCGNVCPHGSLFDVVLMPLSQNKKLPGWISSKTFILGFFAFFMFNFGRRVLMAWQAWGSYDFLDRLGFVFVATYLVVMVLGSSVALAVNPRVWCQFCPMGTMQKGVYHLGKITGIAEKTDTKVTICSIDKCVSCAKCEKVCPFQLSPYENFDENGQFNDANCIKCQTCVANCPVKVLSMEKTSAVAKKAEKISGEEADQKSA
ncbi:4Fe-4S binding protein [Anoxynatronum buryatiense]|uniref:4Fe-4S binding domain-containing protein n=1 Tax=Anoxynatronum buryatiense TaxID=489973 RepID=A0AA45WWP4_9CLOT|nr:4Fe-4S binding protein [Anoxynatronum buryatiense]SMP58786.1 4Fe-4S binding domain-containing protein [Anoxynatronum buryatiense]